MHEDENENDDIGPIQILSPEKEDYFILDAEIIPIQTFATWMSCSMHQIHAAIRMGQLPKPKAFCGQKVWLGSDLKNHIQSYLQQGISTNGK